MTDKKINTQADFDHRCQLIQAKVDKLIDELKSFAKEQGLEVGVVLNFQCRNPVPVHEDDERIEVQMLDGTISNRENPAAAMIRAGLRIIEHEAILEPRKADDPITSLKRAASFAEHIDIDEMQKIGLLLEAAESLAPLLKMVENAESDGASAIIREAVTKMNSGAVH